MSLITRLHNQNSFLECFCKWQQATLAKRRQRARCRALCQTHRPWGGKEGRTPSCVQQEMVGQLWRVEERMVYPRVGLVGWLWNASSKKGTLWFLRAWLGGCVAFMSWFFPTWAVLLPWPESFQRRSVAGWDVSVQCRKRKCDALVPPS